MASYEHRGHQCMYKYVARACLDTCVLAEQDGTTRNFPSSTHGSSFFIWGPFPDRRRSAELDAKQLFIRTMEKKAVDWGERRDATASPCGMRVWRTWSTWHGLGPNVRQPSVVVGVPNTVRKALTSTYRPRADGHLVVCFFVHRSRIRNPVLPRSPNCTVNNTMRHY